MGRCVWGVWMKWGYDLMRNGRLSNEFSLKPKLPLSFSFFSLPFEHDCGLNWQENQAPLHEEVLIEAHYKLAINLTRHLLFTCNNIHFWRVETFSSSIV